MRREWENLPEFAGVIGALWFVVGLVAFAWIASSTEGPQHAGIRGAGVIALCVWIGPFVVAGVLFACCLAFICIAASIPRRVAKPVLEDARSARNRGAA
jgi:chromate transport protein ChrA